MVPDPSLKQGACNQHLKPYIDEQSLRTDAMGVDETEGIDDYLALHGLNWVDYDSYTAGVQALERLYRNTLSAG